MHETFWLMFNETRIFVFSAIADEKSWYFYFLRCPSISIRAHSTYEEQILFHNIVPKVQGE